MLFRLVELQRLDVVLLLKLAGIFITLLVWQPFSKPKKKQTQDLFLQYFATYYIMQMYTAMIIISVIVMLIKNN